MGNLKSLKLPKGSGIDLSIPKKNDETVSYFLNNHSPTLSKSTEKLTSSPPKNGRGFLIKIGMVLSRNFPQVPVADL